MTTNDDYWTRHLAEARAHTGPDRIPHSRLQTAQMLVAKLVRADTVLRGAHVHSAEFKALTSQIPPVLAHLMMTLEAQSDTGRMTEDDEQLVTAFALRLLAAEKRDAQAAELMTRHLARLHAPEVRL